MSGVRLAWDLLRAEGPRGFTERLADRLTALGDRLEERAISQERLAREGVEAPVLDVLSTPLVPRYGGVPSQLGARRAEEARLRPTALLSPEAGRWTLRLTWGGETLRASLGLAVAGGHPSVGPGGGVEAIHEAARLVRSRIVNLEGVAGWPPADLRELAGERARLVVSVHDFALFCPRPNLIEEPANRFCGYSRDAGRCGACLAATWEVKEGFLEEWRRDAADVLAAADAVVYPSEFLRRQYATLFPRERRGLERVIEPPMPGPTIEGPAPVTRQVGRGGALAGGLPRVAFVGAYRPHKGARIFEELLTRCAALKRPVHWSIYGSGDPALVTRARRLGVREAAHYRAGSLARRLREEEVDVALLLSIWPETYSLTLSECRAAGVTVIALDHGAIGERVAAEGGGVLVPPEAGAAGIAAALEKLLSGDLPVRRFLGSSAGSTAREAATARMELYSELLGGPK